MFKLSQNSFNRIHKFGACNSFVVEELYTFGFICLVFTDMLKQHFKTLNALLTKQKPIHINSPTFCNHVIYL